MSDSSNIVVETAQRILQDHCNAAVINKAETGEWPAALWDRLEEAGLAVTWVPEELGGAGAEVTDGFGVLRKAGEFAAPLPLAETLMAGFLLAQGRIAVPPGPLTLAPIHAADRIMLDAQGRLAGSARDVPFARAAQHIAVLAERDGQSCIALVVASGCEMTHGTSLAGEPRDRIFFDGVTAVEVAPVPGFDHAMLMTLGAAVRCAQMAGALERILNQSLQYAQERVQFGRPISNFQVIQHNLAQLAAEAAAASAAAGAVEEAIAEFGLQGAGTLAEVAAAKVRVGEAASTGSAFAHQVHGAMGFTYEHTLHHCTRRLWSWRDEFGNESHWAMLLGSIAAQHGAEGLWPFVTGTTT